MSMSPRCVPVVTSRLPALSAAVRSLTFSTAFFAVGEQTPTVQFMFFVGNVEITTSAFACEESGAAHTSNTSMAARFRIEEGIFIFFSDGSLRRRVGDQVREASVDLAILRPDFRIEASGESRLKLRRRQARDAGNDVGVP